MLVSLNIGFVQSDNLFFLGGRENYFLILKINYFLVHPKQIFRRKQDHYRYR